MESQLTIAKQAGIPYAQGFYLGKPLPLKDYFHMK
jgi:EAL domain-containing protein (putative c-di-GMP-specific phosphodiesterase class I)